MTSQPCKAAGDEDYQCDSKLNTSSLSTYCMPHGCPVIHVLYRASRYSAGLMPGTALHPVLAILTASADGVKLLLHLISADPAVAELSPAVALLKLDSRRGVPAVVRHVLAVAVLVADSCESSASSLHLVMSLLSRLAGVTSAEGPPNRLRLGSPLWRTRYR